jgi:sulfur relay (sulfurtransferase) complex TusBCD TusD component (DsrE family)
MTTPTAFPLTTIVINRNGMGEAEPELQQKLIKAYLSMLINQQPLPATICLYASGVHLAAEGSAVLEELKALLARGVYIILCSTCVNYYNLNDRIAVGVVGGMHDILEAQWRADRVITL